MDNKVILSAGLVGLAGYLPAKKIPNSEEFSKFLEEETTLHPDYIASIKESGCLPGTIETNYDGWESQPWFDSWLKSLPSKKQSDAFQGTKERRRVPLDPCSVKNSLYPHPMLSSDAETLAGALAIFNSNINKSEIDLVLVSSLVPDRHVPLNASLVQHKLGLNAGAYNVDTCCSSFVTMMEVASTYVRCGLKKKVLIIASSLDSIVNDKSTYYSVDTGDAAVAGIVAEEQEGYGYLSSCSTSHGSRHSAIIFQKRKPNLLVTTTQCQSYDHDYVTFHDMEMCREIACNAQQDMKEVVEKALTKAGFTIKDIDFLVTHQPVSWAANAWREALGVPKEKTYESFEKYANIACCSTATNLLEAIEKNLIKKDDKVMVASSGAGENHIALLHKISPSFVENVR